MRPLLDTPELYGSLDPSRMRDRLPDFAGQCQQALRATASLTLPAGSHNAKAVVVAGMGTSALAGEMASDLAQQLGVACPVTVWRDYGLPAWAGTGTLVVACSHSGMTVEVLSAFDCAVERGANVVVVTAGGALAERARRLGLPEVPLNTVWGGRHSLGFTLVALLGVLRAARLLPDLATQVEEAAQLLDQQTARYAPNQPEATNPAKETARRLWGRVPVVYGGGLLAGVARRWKYDLNENAKTWAMADVLPELQHNAVAGYSHPRSLRQDAYVLVLSSERLPGVLRQRIGLTEELLRSAGVSFERLAAEGEAVGAGGLGPLAHQLGLVYLGSWAAYYLALLYGVDPVPTEALQVARQQAASAGTGAWGLGEGRLPGCR